MKKLVLVVGLLVASQGAWANAVPPPAPIQYRNNAPPFWAGAFWMNVVYMLARAPQMLGL